jgi:hypothetical protein
MPIPLVRLNAQNNDSNSVHKFMPAAQWSRHSCLHFKYGGLAFDGSNFPWFDCEP